MNIAARLMAKANGCDLVDPVVVAAPDTEEKACLIKYKEYKLSPPITPYTFGDGDVNLSVLRTKDEGEVINQLTSPVSPQPLQMS